MSFFLNPAPLDPLVVRFTSITGAGSIPLDTSSAGFLASQTFVVDRNSRVVTYNPATGMFTLPAGVYDWQVEFTPGSDTLLDVNFAFEAYIAGNRSQAMDYFYGLSWDSNHMCKKIGWVNPTQSVAPLQLYCWKELAGSAGYIPCDTVPTAHSWSTYPVVTITRTATIPA